MTRQYSIEMRMEGTEEQLAELKALVIASARIIRKHAKEIPSERFEILTFSDDYFMGHEELSLD